MSFLVSSPFPIFEDVDGQPLENGMIYIGTVNLNPQSNPVAVFWDAALTQPAAQPIRTSGGFPVRSGTPSRIYTASSYSIMVTNSKEKLVFSELSAGVSSLVSGMFSGVITDLNFDPTLLGMVDAEVRLLVTNSSPSNKPAGADTGTYYLITLAKVSASEYRLQMTQSGAMGSIMTRYYSSGVWSDWNANGQSPLSLTTGSSPYTLVAGTVPTIFVSATTNPYIINLPQCSASKGFIIDIVSTSQALAGNVKVAPFAGDSIGPLVIDAPIYIQNIDQSGWVGPRKHVRLISDGIGSWAISGQWVPDPTAATALGGEYFLGSLVTFPLTSVANRTVSVNPGAVGTWVLSGATNVPSGAKAILARVIYTSSVVAANAAYEARFYFSDNQTTTPGLNTAHPMIYGRSISPNVANGTITLESMNIVIPLDSAKKFNVYTETATGFVVATNMIVTVLGYYMGV